MGTCSGSIVVVISDENDSSSIYCLLFVSLVCLSCDKVVDRLIENCIFAKVEKPDRVFFFLLVCDYHSFTVANDVRMAIQFP